MTKDEERVLMAVDIARELAMLLLQKHGAVLPFGLTLVFFLLCPYTGSGQRWQLEEPQAAEGVLVEPFMSSPGPQ